MQTPLPPRLAAGENAPYRRLVIGGYDITPDLAESGTSLSYAVEEGTSELTVACHRGLRELVNAPVRLSLGYGEESREYFSGRLYGAEGSCFGPFKLAGETKFSRTADYRGWGADEAIYDILYGAGYRHGDIEVRSRRRFILEGDTAVFAKNVTRAEAVSQIAENAGRVVSDMPGGRRLVMPAPRPGATGEAVASYTMETIPAGDDGLPAFTASEGSFTRNLYSAVRVFRNAEDGSPEVDVTLPVSTEGRHSPPAGRYYDVPEFVGDEAAAWETAAQYARLLSRGTYSCELPGIPANTAIEPYASVRVEAEEHELALAGGSAERFERVYRFLADDQIGVEISREGGHSMSVSGEGLMLSEKRLAKPYYIGGSGVSRVLGKRPESPDLAEPPPEIVRDTALYAIASSADDGFVAGRGDTYPPPYSSHDFGSLVMAVDHNLYQGNYDLRIGLLRFTGSIPEGATVTGARLRITPERVEGAYLGGEITADPYGWDGTAGDYVTTARTGALGEAPGSGYALSELSAGVEETVPLENASAWVADTVSLRLHLRLPEGETPDDGTRRVYFETFEGGSPAALEVDYEYEVA